MDAQEEYWYEAVSIALEEMGKLSALTMQERVELGKALSVSAENQSMAFGWDVASVNLSASREREKADLQKALVRERNKITCRECNGRGTIAIPGPYHSSTHVCYKCHGEGRHDP